MEVNKVKDDVLAHGGLEQKGNSSLEGRLQSGIFQLPLPFSSVLLKVKTTGRINVQRELLYKL